MSVGSAARKSGSLQIQDTQFIPLAVQTADWKHVAESEVPGLVSVETATEPILNPDDPKIIIDYSAFAECLRLCLLYDGDESQAESKLIDRGSMELSADEDRLRADGTNALEEACV